MAKPEVAVIGGTGFESLLTGARTFRVKTPYGTTLQVYSGKLGGKDIIFLPRHGRDHSVPPHKINYRANIYALHKLGIKRVLAINAVGAINATFKPGDLAVPHDFVDFTKLRATTFYDKKPVTHVDFSQPYCPEIRGLLIRKANEINVRVWDRAVLACTEGPRYETPAEIEMLRRCGCDIVGMTGCPEAALARELEMCYATVCFVSNMAAGMQKRLTMLELGQISKRIHPKMEQLLIETIEALPTERGTQCPCSKALDRGSSSV